MWLKITLIYKHVCSNKNVLQFNTFFSPYCKTWYSSCNYLFFQQMITFSAYLGGKSDCYLKSEKKTVSILVFSTFVYPVPPDEHFTCHFDNQGSLSKYTESASIPYSTSNLHFYICINRTSACPSAFCNLIRTAL